jgi:hypothetical protein
VLRTKFRGEGWVSIDDVEKFVLVGTIFSETMHLRRETLGAMELEKSTVLEVRPPVGKRNVAGQYPPGTHLRFL